MSMCKCLVVGMNGPTNELLYLMVVYYRYASLAKCQKQPRYQSIKMRVKDVQQRFVFKLILII